MITSKVKEVNTIKIPEVDNNLSMLQFNMNTLNEVPGELKQCVEDMIKHLPDRNSNAFLTVDRKVVKSGETHRRGGAHIDGNYMIDVCAWGGKGGGNGWKVGEGGAQLNTEQHKLSYENEDGGIIITSNYPTCKGWSGVYNGSPRVGGDCTHLELDKGFILEENVVYHGNSRFIHESLPLKENVDRTMIRVTLPLNYKN